MPTLRKVLIFNDTQIVNDHSTHEGRLVIGDPRRFNSIGPKLILYRAPGEKIIQGPRDILKLLQAENIVREGTIRVRNPLTHGQYCFVVSLAENHDTIITCSSPYPCRNRLAKGTKGTKG